MYKMWDTMAISDAAEKIRSPQFFALLSSLFQPQQRTFGKYVQATLNTAALIQVFHKGGMRQPA
jgi:hypothetical protein